MAKWQPGTDWERMDAELKRLRSRGPFERLLIWVAVRAENAALALEKKRNGYGR